MPKLHELGVAEAANAIRTGEIKAEALADALLARTAAHASLNAFITLDADRVRAAAREADRQRASGASLGKLHGVPLALKDNLDTAEYRTSGGTPGLAGHRPKRNAVIVEALLDAGAIALGKCNLHELAYGITNNNAAFGPARNPYAPDRIPGASSGGTGVAVAARLAPGGIGTDTGGSVRIPAALCGIVGLRPTTGRWSQAGIVPISHTRDTAWSDDPQRRRLRVDGWRRDRRADRGGAGAAQGPAHRRAAPIFLGKSRTRARRKSASKHCRASPTRASRSSTSI